MYFINAANALNVDGTNASDLTRAETECREQVYEIENFMRKYTPGFERCYVDRVAARIGVRETVRIQGKYTLTRGDVLEARHFDDGVVPGCNSIDVHDVDGKVFKHQYLRAGAHYQIPWRCFLPETVTGLIVTGRCLSADHYALGSVRVMAVCMPMGEACGAAAALAAGESITPDKLPAEKIREILRAGGTVI